MLFLMPADLTLVFGILGPGKLDERLVRTWLALAARPRVLPPDEPVAGLGKAETEAMRALLARPKRQVTVARGDPDAIRADPEGRTAYLGEGDG